MPHPLTMTKLYKRLVAIVLFGALLVAAGSALFNLSAFAATSPTLGAAATYSVLAGTTVTNTGPTTTNRRVGVSPGSAITGFPPGIAGGGKHAADGNAAAAQLDNTAAFLALSAAPNVACTTYAGIKDLVGLTLVPGVYCAGAFELSGTLTLDAQGNANAVWIFRSAATLITSAGAVAKVRFLNGIGSSCNVWWKVVSSATLKTGTEFIGNILASTSIDMNTNATLNGRVMAQTGAVTLASNVITTPSCGENGFPDITPTITAVPTLTATQVAATATQVATSAATPGTPAEVIRPGPPNTGDAGLLQHTRSGQPATETAFAVTFLLGTVTLARLRPKRGQA
jgi:type VI secretion system secreted protein VgrG